MTRNGLDDVKACDVRSGWMTSHVGSEQVVNSSHGTSQEPGNTRLKLW